MIAPKQISKALEEHWPPWRIVVSCRDCEGVIWDSRKKNLRGSPVRHSVPYISSWIHAEMRGHQSRTGDHNNFDIGIEPVSVAKEIDANVTINGESI